MIQKLYSMDHTAFVVTLLTWMQTNHELPSLKDSTMISPHVSI
jgi:hypothetical protein